MSCFFEIIEPDAAALTGFHPSRSGPEPFRVAGKLLVKHPVQVRQGEVLAVVGPSRAGKSSFLRLISGQATATAAPFW
jgi:ABC-type polysaccharide/polyol phosphate transport system ATPase subunit